LLGEAGYPVTQNADGSFSCPKFPEDKVEFIYNAQPANKAVAEWMQAQWKQNLGITVASTKPGMEDLFRGAGQA
jgi:ABC-type transport system substrate-binding protein